MRSRHAITQRRREVGFTGLVGYPGGPGQVFAARGRDLCRTTLRRNPDMFIIPGVSMTKALLAVTISRHPAAHQAQARLRWWPVRLVGQPGHPRRSRSPRPGGCWQARASAPGPCAGRAANCLYEVRAARAGGWRRIEHEWPRNQRGVP